jgi:hypothetical protein
LRIEQRAGFFLIEVLLSRTIILCSGLLLEHALGILPTLDQPERERKKYALEENDNANPETRLLCSDSHCDLGQSVLSICFRRSGTLSSRLPAYKSILLLPIAAKTGGVSVFIPGSPAGT